MNIEIGREELQSKLSGAAPPVLVEALPPASFEKGHLPGALNVPLDGFAARARHVLPDLDSEIVVYCASPTCANSHTAQRLLASLGYRRVRVYAGGKSDWTGAGNALEVSHGTR